jgi:hypothetical protein
MVTVHVAPLAVSQPLHPVKSESSAGDAVNVTVVPITYVPVQVVPQLIPAGLDVTVPWPRPVLPTVNVKVFSVNTAVTDRPALIVTLQVAPATESHPVHPAKFESAPGDAINVTAVLIT